jgi:hypothetical protein
MLRFEMLLYFGMFKNTMDILFYNFQLQVCSQNACRNQFFKILGDPNHSLKRCPFVFLKWDKN